MEQGGVRADCSGKTAKRDRRGRTWDSKATSSQEGDAQAKRLQSRPGIQAWQKRCDKQEYTVISKWRV